MERGHVPTHLDRIVDLGTGGRDFIGAETKFGDALFPERVFVPNISENVEGLFSPNASVNLLLSERFVRVDGGVRGSAIGDGSFCWPTDTLSLLSACNRQIAFNLAIIRNSDIPCPYCVKSWCLTGVIDLQIRDSLASLGVEVKRHRVDRYIGSELGPGGPPLLQKSPDEHSSANYTDEQARPRIASSFASRVRSLPLSAKVGIAIIFAGIASWIFVRWYLDIGDRSLNAPKRFRNLVLSLAVFGVLIAFWWSASPG